MGEFRMPSLGADMETGTVLEWRVSPGDEVARGDVIAVVDTEKSDIEVEVFESGVVAEILVPVGTEVAVGTPLAIIAEASRPAEAASTRKAAPGPEAAPPMRSDSPMSASGRGSRSQNEEGDEAEGPTEETRGVRGPSPLARRLAANLGLDLATVRGTGRGGAVTRADVERVAAERERRPPTERVPSSPLARRRASELGIELATLRGTGPGGAIKLRDVEAAAETDAAIKPRDVDASAGPGGRKDTGERHERDRTSATRRATGALMARSKREIPHYYLSTTIDLQRSLAWLDEVNRERPIRERLLPAALLAKATALATRQVPRLNGWWTEDDLALAGTVNLGIGISLRGGGLVSPVLARAEELDLTALMARLREIVGRARAGKLRASDMSEASLTITNLGDQGVESVFGVIAPPQVAVVGFGTIKERPWAVSGMLDVRPLVTATLSADHRASDGHEGARFLSTIDRLLQEPEKL